MVNAIMRWLFFIRNKRIFDDFNITFCYNENRGRYEK